MLVHEALATLVTPTSAVGALEVSFVQLAQARPEEVPLEIRAGPDFVNGSCRRRRPVLMDVDGVHQGAARQPRIIGGDRAAVEQTIRDRRAGEACGGRPRRIGNPRFPRPAQVLRVGGRLTKRIDRCDPLRAFLSELGTSSSRRRACTCRARRRRRCSRPAASLPASGGGGAPPAPPPAADPLAPALPAVRFPTGSTDARNHRPGRASGAGRAGSGRSLRTRTARASSARGHTARTPIPARGVAGSPASRRAARARADVGAALTSGTRAGRVAARRSARAAPRAIADSLVVDAARPGEERQEEASLVSHQALVILAPRLVPSRRRFGAHWVNSMPHACA